MDCQPVIFEHTNQITANLASIVAVELVPKLATALWLALPYCFNKTELGKYLRFSF